MRMFRFNKEQKIFDIAGVKIGGQPGQLPTVMIGSIFYSKQKIFEDEKSGLFSREKAEDLLNKEKEISDKTGNPRIVDVCCTWPQAFRKLIEFVADKIDGPFAIDGTTEEARIAGAKYVGEVGLSERVLYNSVMPHIKEAEISAIKEARIKSAVLLTYNAKNPTIAGRMQVLDELIGLASKAGIEKILVDTTVLDIPDPGPVSKVVYLVKEKYGLPAGAGTHNAVQRWNRMRRLDREIFSIASSVADVLPICMGANFVIYGPIENASNAYFHCALADAYVAYSVRQEFGTRPLTSNHPLFKIFKV
ncbi:MAG: tetrahydromethanopterin S-methyltransferase subunit H [Thermoproteota archaeon]